LTLRFLSYEISGHEDHICLFCSITSATGHPPLGTKDCLPVTASLVSCLVLPRLDYCNTVLAGIPLHHARRLQSVMNAAARLVFASSKCDHIMPLLRQLHWLDRLQADRPALQISSWSGSGCHRHTLPTNFTFSRVTVSKTSAFRFLLRAVHSPYPTVNLRRTSFSSRRCTDLEQSSAAYHICSVTSCLLLSLEDILLRTLLPVITVVVPAK